MNKRPAECDPGMLMSVVEARDWRTCFAGLDTAEAERWQVSRTDAALGGWLGRRLRTRPRYRCNCSDCPKRAHDLMPSLPRLPFYHASGSVLRHPEHRRRWKFAVAAGRNCLRVLCCRCAAMP